jgi:hypothetical protein
MSSQLLQQLPGFVVVGFVIIRGRSLRGSFRDSSRQISSWQFRGSSWQFSWFFVAVFVFVLFQLRLVESGWNVFEHENCHENCHE